MYKTTSFTLLAAAGMALALVACGGGDGDGGSGTGPVVGQNGTVDVGGVSMSGGETCGIGGFAQKLLAEINAARAKARSCGGQHMAAAPAIPYWNTLLQTAAVKHSADMTANNFFSHTGSDGSSGYDRAMSVGYQGGVGENLYQATGNYSAPSGLVGRSVNWWLNSPGHCLAIMEPTFREIGAGCIKRGDKATLTLMFGSGQF